MNYKVKKLDRNDWRDYRNIRLEALKNDPSAFGSSYHDCKNKDDSYWIDNLSPVDKQKRKKFFYAILSENSFVSIGGAYQDENNEWNIAAIYTRREFRRLGAGSLLFEAILQELKNRDVKKVFLRVNANRKEAVSLYEKFGFRKIKTVSGQVLGDGKVYSEYDMCLKL